MLAKVEEAKAAVVEAAATVDRRAAAATSRPLRDVMDQVIVELLKYGFPGLCLLVLGWAYLQDRADRKAAENRLIEYLRKDRDAVLAVSHSAVAAIGEATQAHVGTFRTLEAMASRSRSASGR